MPDRKSKPAAKTQYAQVDGSRIAYREIGSGSPVVLANRLRGTIDTWDPAFLDKLAERHTVITFDYPGIGYSTGKMPDDIGQIARVINEFTMAIKLEKFTMAGLVLGRRCGTGRTARPTRARNPCRPDRDEPAGSCRDSAPARIPRTCCQASQ